MPTGRRGLRALLTPLWTVCVRLHVSLCVHCAVWRPVARPVVPVSCTCSLHSEHPTERRNLPSTRTPTPTATLPRLRSSRSSARWPVRVWHNHVIQPPPCDPTVPVATLNCMSLASTGLMTMFRSYLLRAATSASLSNESYIACFDWNSPVVRCLVLAFNSLPAMVGYSPGNILKSAAMKLLMSSSFAVFESDDSASVAWSRTGTVPQQTCCRNILVPLPLSSLRVLARQPASWMMQQRLPQNDAMMRHRSTSETMRMAVRDTERECLGEACRRCVCNQHQDWELHDRRRNQHKRPTSSVRGHEVLQENLLLPITSYQKSFLAPIGPTVSNRAASCATLQRQRSLSSVLTQARLFLSRLVASPACCL